MRTHSQIHLEQQQLKQYFVYDYGEALPSLFAWLVFRMSLFLDSQHCSKWDALFVTFTSMLLDVYTKLIFSDLVRKIAKSDRLVVPLSACNHFPL